MGGNCCGDPIQEKALEVEVGGGWGDEKGGEKGGCGDKKGGDQGGKKADDKGHGEKEEGGWGWSSASWGK